MSSAVTATSIEVKGNANLMANIKISHPLNNLSGLFTLTRASYHYIFLAFVPQITKEVKTDLQQSLHTVATTKHVYLQVSLTVALLLQPLDVVKLRFGSLSHTN
jgi:hypothetical protein